jgi:predicted nucleic acid-binding protein
LAGNYVQELTLYEAANAFWKEAKLLRVITPEEALRLMQIVSKLAELMRVVSVRGLEEEALRIALEHGVTVYDASYIAVAREHSLTLVTENRELRRIAENYVEARSLDEL